jgi:ligand-binding SRPBCC domain-containing protein
MWVYKHRFVVNASLREVSEFHGDATALKKLTLPPAWVQMHEVQPLKEGSLARFTIWLGPIPVRWLAIHQDVDPERGFTDIQMEGPFQTWRHRHSFVQTAENFSEVHDEIQAEPGKSLLKRLICTVMWITLPLLFAYRAWITRRTIEGRG